VLAANRNGAGEARHADPPSASGGLENQGSFSDGRKLARARKNASARSTTIGAGYVLVELRPSLSSLYLHLPRKWDSRPRLSFSGLLSLTAEAAVPHITHISLVIQVSQQVRPSRAERRRESRPRR